MDENNSVEMKGREWERDKVRGQGAGGGGQATGRERLEKFTKIVVINLEIDQHWKVRIWIKCLVLLKHPGRYQ